MREKEFSQDNSGEKTQEIVGHGNLPLSYARGLRERLNFLKSEEGHAELEIAVALTTGAFVFAFCLGLGLTAVGYIYQDEKIMYIGSAVQGAVAIGSLLIPKFS